ncbi:MAG: nucleotidyl transferase AbiEii/AbiGii toxin family protein [Candidatus Rokubacteria bacterium]|nr:nucleotidyl transferase AbiEii/AbiGii toxin family protein [Candidatus Rokubacteria bacterium]
MLEVLRQVDRVAREVALDYFVVGAMARDILLTGVFGLDAGRATRDVDLAVAVEGWPQFEAVKARLVGTGAFVSTEGAVQRLYHRATPERTDYWLDLIPFGGVEQPQHQIAWPPDQSVIMNVAGFDEARACAVPVEVAPGFVVRVASLPGFAILKLVAWTDRGASDPRDAIDLATLLHRYGGAGNEDRLYGTEIAILEVANYDFDLAGARLLGMDASRIAAPATRGQVLSILDDAVYLDRLVHDVARGLVAEDSVAVAGGLLAQFRAGFHEGRPAATRH